MKTITNKTNGPIKVPLPRNKSLRLGPGRSERISDEVAARPALVKMVEAGQIELADAGGTAATGGGHGGGFGNAGRSGGGSSVGRRGGDR